MHKEFAMILPAGSVVVPDDTLVEHSERAQSPWLTKPSMEGAGVGNLVSKACAAGARRHEIKLGIKNVANLDIRVLRVNCLIKPSNT